MIKLENISHIYSKERSHIQALRCINLQIKTQEIFGILGKSGAGKSTLLRCLNLLERPTQGQVWLDGVNLLSLSSQALCEKRHAIGMVFQHFNLLESRSVFGNVALPLELTCVPAQEITTRVNELLRLVNLSDRARHYPQELSGGQKQRVAIARALATKPSVLLCDEATSALDPEATQSILTLLKKIQKELHLTVVLITHELEVVKQLCDRVGVMQAGELVEVNNTFSLFAEPVHQVSKQFLHNPLEFQLIQKYMQQPSVSNRQLIKLTFVGADSEKPLISYLAKHFAVDISILHADITDVQNRTIGHTLGEISGNPDDIKQALHYIQSTSVKLQVFTNAS